MQKEKDIEKFKKIISTPQGQNMLMTVFIIFGAILIWSAGMIEDYGMVTAAEMFSLSGTVCIMLFVLILFVRVMKNDKKEEDKDIVDEIEEEISLPWIVNGVCDTEILAANKVACNLEYACDGCPYNKSEIEKE